jgi:hypothetical protein
MIRLNRTQTRTLIAFTIISAFAALLGVSQFFIPSSYAQGGYSLRFHGAGVDDIDRVKIRIDSPARPADIGAADFTIEFWMRGSAAENTAAARSCGANDDWIYGNIIVDRDRFGLDRKFGLSLVGGKLMFGATGAGSDRQTICGAANVLDNQWHHIAVQRRVADGYIWIYIDGQLDGQGDGPDGDISYPDGAAPSTPGGGFCQGPGGSWGGQCVNDPYLVIGAEKHDAGTEFPSYSGWVDELRLSTTLRYGGPFTRPSQPFVTDASTAALYHFDEGSGNTIADSSGAAGGPSTGERRPGGSPEGPEWSTDTPFGSVAPSATPSATEPASASSTPTSTPTATLTPPPDASATPSPTATVIGTAPQDEQAYLPIVRAHPTEIAAYTAPAVGALDQPAEPASATASADRSTGSFGGNNKSALAAPAILAGLIVGGISIMALRSLRKVRLG